MSETKKKSYTGLLVGGLFGLAGLGIVALATPFILPALRRHCLPYVPATDIQLNNISKAIKRYSTKGESFLDVGSGDGRVCELSARLGTFSKVHGVELNSVLVLYSRLTSLRSGSRVSYFRQDLWKFPIHEYDSVCIFGVESMMEPLAKKLIESNIKPQTIIACRFPLNRLEPVGEIGDGLDTVWIYKIATTKV